MLGLVEKQEIMLSFPNIKLCYDNLKHNKVDLKNETKNKFDVCLAIPCGKKCFAWFTQVQNKNVCLILELSNNKNINDIKIVNCVFNNNLVYGEYGTIFYGTLFQYYHYTKSNKSLEHFFTVEDVFYYKGENVANYNWFDKFNLLLNIFKNDVKQITYNKRFLVFGLPLIAQNLNELKILINDVKYKIYNINLQCLNDINRITTISYANLDAYIVSYEKNKIQTSLQPTLQVQRQLQLHLQTVINNKKQPFQKNTVNTSVKKCTEIIFNIKPDIQNDIYNLYCIENRKEVFYNIAYIPDYKTSVMMNKLFRNIKENDNLDLLEESDDEEEFQNENLDRFVDINKSFLFVCKYNYKFKKWFPVKLFDNVKRKEKIENILVKKEELINYETNFKSNKNKNYNNTKTKS